MRKLFNAYFRTYYVPAGPGGGTNGLAGPDVYNYEHGTILRRVDSPICTPNTEYNVYANTPDCIFFYDECPDIYADQVQYPDVGAVAAFTFEDGPVNGHAYLQNGVCATALELPIYRAFYFSFDFSQLTDPTDRAEWMADIAAWFNLEPSAADDPAVPELDAGISTIWPNPFQASCNISLRLPPKALPISIFTICEARKCAASPPVNLPKAAMTLSGTAPTTSELPWPAGFITSACKQVN